MSTKTFHLYFSTWTSNLPLYKAFLRHQEYFGVPTSESSLLKTTTYVKILKMFLLFLPSMDINEKPCFVNLMQFSTLQ